MNTLITIAITISIIFVLMLIVKFYARYRKQRHLKKIYKQAGFELEKRGSKLTPEIKKQLEKMLFDPLKK